MSEEAQSNSTQGASEQPIKTESEDASASPTKESAPFHQIVARGIHKIVRAIMPPLRR